MNMYITLVSCFLVLFAAISNLFLFLVVRSKPLKIKIVTHGNAKNPTCATLGSAGYDLYTPYEVEIPSRGRVKIALGISMELPDGFYGKIESKSGLALNEGLSVLTGILDSDYRGEIHVLLQNNSNTSVTLERGAKVAQMIFMKHERAEFINVSYLSETPRGTNGFGSSGKF